MMFRPDGAIRLNLDSLKVEAVFAILPGIHIRLMVCLALDANEMQDPRD